MVEKILVESTLAQIGGLMSNRARVAFAKVTLPAVSFVSDSASRIGMVEHARPPQAAIATAMLINLENREFVMQPRAGRYAMCGPARELAATGRLL
jgi:hypothetical protein